MVQGYMRSEDVAIRVRKQGARAVVTFKARESGAVRGEWEYEIPPADAEELIGRFCEERVVRKTRHYVPIAGRRWEIDVFEGRHEGLVIAELELDAEDEEFDHPPWLGPEVTDDASYYNEALALDAHAR